MSLARLSCLEIIYVRLVVDLGDLEGRESSNRGLAGKRHCGRGSPREGERRASERVLVLVADCRESKWQRCSLPRLNADQ